jgi:hypothetical protein
MSPPRILPARVAEDATVAMVATATIANKGVVAKVVTNRVIFHI